MPPANLLSLVVKIENVQYGKRAYEELDLLLRELIKECVIRKQPGFVSIACKTEAMRSLYGTHLHGKRVMLLNKEFILRIEGMDDTSCGAKESGSDNESGDSDDSETNIEGEDQGGDEGEDNGDDEGDLDDAPQNGINGAVVEQETIKRRVQKARQDTSAPLKKRDQQTAFRAKGWELIGEFKDIIGSNDTSNAFAEMALYWVQSLVQKNSISPSDIDIVVYDIIDHLGVRANFKDRKPNLGSFSLGKSHWRNAAVEFVIQEDPVDDILSVYQTPTHTSEFQGICAAFVQSGTPVSFFSPTHRQEFDDNRGIFGLFHSERAARKCRNRSPKSQVRKCGWCCGTHIRIGGRFSAQRIPAKNPRWLQKDEYHSWLLVFFDLAISAGLNVYIPEYLLSKYFAAPAPESNVNIKQPNSSAPTHNSSSTKIQDETILSLRPTTPSVNRRISTGYSIGGDSPPPDRNVETKSSLASELVDRVVEKSHELMEARKIIENQKSLILQQAQSLNDKTSTAQRAEKDLQRLHIADILDRQKKGPEEWEKRVPEETQKTAPLQKRLDELYKSNHRLIDRHKAEISDMVKRSKGKESLLKKAEEKIRAIELNSKELEIQMAKTTITGYQSKEKEGELKLAIGRIFGENNAIGARLRDLEADYEIQGRNLRIAREDKEKIIQAMRQAGYDFEENHVARKRGPSHENEHQAKKMKTEQ
ncbi:hypothetical protein HYALB_00010441 [Hymenoscyphus albidus]|uniref:Uncharacterized protein n=1 Tax=Hymenoscyphus albidus TaxID=595503 RepID=A0A9N9PST0_9HELO|nr:hypothetical protein HYALB_00010441 [Hymenoscyphus albidus]